MAVTRKSIKCEAVVGSSVFSEHTARTASFSPDLRKIKDVGMIEVFTAGGKIQGAFGSGERRRLPV
jgi:hypothetical protein